MEITEEQVTIEWSDKEEIVRLWSRPQLESAHRVDDFVKLVREGGAVDARSVDNKLPRADKIAFIERSAKMVAVAALKRADPDYAAKLSSDERSGYKIGGDIPELGYVAVSETYRGLHLSSRVVQTILADSSGQLFATTTNQKMKSILATNGFRWVGKPWQGKQAEEKLSLWIRVE